MRQQVNSTTNNMSAYIRGFQEIDKTMLALVGGKGANLGELSRIEGVQVSEGFCITTEVYKEIIRSSNEVKSLLNQLRILKADDRKRISEISAKIREAIESTPVSKEITEEIEGYLVKFGEKDA